LSEANSGVGPQPVMEPPTFGQQLRDAVTDALRYWEPRRWIYNGVLAAIVLGYALANFSRAITVVTFDGVLGVFLLAVLANVAYSAAYVGDLFVQVSGLREVWQKWRWILWLIGTTFAAIVTRFFAMGFFSPPRSR
jgi:hypothetical protein